jgi:peptide/nickel transport system ATP-binding protein
VIAISARAPAVPLLDVSELHVTFAAGVRAVRGAGFTVTPGEVLAIVGESGAGKSATALAIMGLLPVSAHVAGSVRLRGRELLGLGDRDLAAVRGDDLAMVFQDSAFTPVYRVGDQIAEAVRANARVPRRSAAARAIELLALAGIPDAARVARAFPHELSGGLCRRAMIAMAVAGDPAVILADEPTSALDVTVQAQVLDALQTMQSRTRAALILITHDLGVVAGRADRVMVMYAGRPVETGPVDEVFGRPRMPYTAGLLRSAVRLDRPYDRPLPIAGPPPSATDPRERCAFEPRCPLATGECRIAVPPLRPVGAPGHRAACVHASETAPADHGRYAHDGPVRASDQGPPVLEVDGLVRHYPLVKSLLPRRRTVTVRAVDGIDFDIRTGETLGLVGESGCGKTTTLLEILRLGALQEGRVAVFGRDTTALSNAERRVLRRDVQIVFQDPGTALDPRATVGAILAEPLRAHGHARRGVTTRVPELLRLVGLEPALAARYPGELSGGQGQRVNIARALALEPKLLILDEPFSALDVSVQAAVIGLLRDLKLRLGLSYLLAAHDLAAVRQLADRAAVMRLGRIVEIGDADAVYGSPAHPYTRALLSAVPLPDPHRERTRLRLTLRDDPGPDPDPPSGCRFRSRCPTFATLPPHEGRHCVDEEPAVRRVRSGQSAACHFPNERSPR